MCLASLSLVCFTPWPVEQLSQQRDSAWHEFCSMLHLLAQPLVCLYIICAFLYVLLEQGIGTWLPTFNNEILHLPVAMSIEATSIFAAGLAMGRLAAGMLLSRLSWYPVLNCCLVMLAVLILVALPLTQQADSDHAITWAQAPLAVFILPLSGVFMAPIYPAINSVMLSALPKHRHAAMAGLLVVFSALGGTSGSLLTGLVFHQFDGRSAFYLSLLPLAMILIALYFFSRAIRRLDGLAA